MNNELESDFVKFIIPEPSANYPFLELEGYSLTSNSHGQIQNKEVHNYIRYKLGLSINDFEFTLKYYSSKKGDFLTQTVKATYKANKVYAVLLVSFFKELLKDDYVDSYELAPGNILKFSKIKNEPSISLEIIITNPNENINERIFLTNIKDILEFSNKVIQFFNLKEENKNDLINRLYDENELEYFEKMEKGFNKKGPIQALRYKILLKMIEDKKKGESHTSVSISFIENTIEDLCKNGFEGDDINRSSFDIIWVNYYYVRVLLELYYIKIEFRKKFLQIVKFLLIKLNLENPNDLNDLDINEEGKIQPYNSLSLKNLKTKNISFTIIDFVGTTSRYTHQTWIALYPKHFNDHKEAYQLFLGINKLKEKELLVGIETGANVVTGKCKENRNRNIKKIFMEGDDTEIVSQIFNVYNKNLKLFNKLNEMEKEYRDLEDIQCWFCSPQPPEDDLYEDNIFVSMMENDFYALGWSEFQKDMRLIPEDILELKLTEETTFKADTINFHLFFKNEMKMGDIIIAKKGDSPQNPDNRIYAIGIIKSDYEFDEDLDPYGTHDFHYRKVNWIINFYKDYKEAILPEPFLDIKSFLKDIKAFDIKTLVKKDFSFYSSLKNAIIEKFEDMKKNNEISDKKFENYFEKFLEIENLAKCFHANRLEGEEITQFKHKEQKKIEEKKTSEMNKEIIAHLVLGRNIIFYGPPGTGKTRIAKQIASLFCGVNNFRIETANAEWTTFDVVGGPTISGLEKLIFKPGFLTLAAKKGLEYKDGKYVEKNEPFWIIIDEINRANLDLAFGKIFTLLDIDYRDEFILSENELIGMENREEYLKLCIPKKFRIIATMNTYDRAILFSLGYAFRRRFAFIEIGSPFRELTESEYSLKEENWKKEVLEYETWDVLKNEMFDLNGSDFKVTPNDFKEKFLELNEAFYAGKYDPYNPYKLVNKISIYLSKNKIVDIGYAQPIDLIKYVLTKLVLYADENFDLSIIRAIDEGIKAYFIPQILYYLPKARRLISLGDNKEGEAAEMKITKLQILFENLSLIKSAKNLKEIILGLKIGDLIKF